MLLLQSVGQALFGLSRDRFGRVVADGDAYVSANWAAQPGQDYLQEAVVVGGFGLAAVHLGGQSDGPLEVSAADLHLRVEATGRCLAVLPLASDSQPIAGDGYLYILLVDAGQDPAVCFRVVADSEPDRDGQFIRRIDLLMLPEGGVGDYALKCHGVHKTLKALLEAGVIK